MKTRRHQGRRDQAARAALEPIVLSGLAICRRCGDPIEPGQAWDAGHVDSLALGGAAAGHREPEHASCNRAAGARLGNLLRSSRARRVRPTEWLAVFFESPAAGTPRGALFFSRTDAEFCQVTP